MCHFLPKDNINILNSTTFQEKLWLPSKYTEDHSWGCLSPFVDLVRDFKKELKMSHHTEVRSWMKDEIQTTVLICSKKRKTRFYPHDLATIRQNQLAFEFFSDMDLIKPLKDIRNTQLCVTSVPLTKRTWLPLSLYQTCAGFHNFFPMEFCREREELRVRNVTLR